MNQSNSPRKLAGCVAASCPAVYKDDDAYVIIGEQQPNQAVPQTVSDDETVVKVGKDLVQEAVS